MQVAAVGKAPVTGTTEYARSRSTPRAQALAELIPDLVVQSFRRCVRHPCRRREPQRCIHSRKILDPSGSVGMAATGPAESSTRTTDEPDTAPDNEEAASGRRLALDVHAQLRGMILSGELPPGSVLPQAKMARVLGVSRTPMREAFRLLQEEGLIESRPDQRARVRGVDPVDLDTVYGSRIALEALAAGITVRTLGETDLRRVQEALELMQVHSTEMRPDQWYAAHREFHRIATQTAGPDLQRILTSLREHSDRYIRFAQLGIPGSSSRARKDHEEIFDALQRADETMLVNTLARHLARTALSVLADIAPEYDPVTTRAALSMATGGPSVTGA